MKSKSQNPNVRTRIFNNKKMVLALRTSDKNKLIAKRKTLQLIFHTKTIKRNGKFELYVRPTDWQLSYYGGQYVD